MVEASPRPRWRHGPRSPAVPATAGPMSAGRWSRTRAMASSAASVTPITSRERGTRTRKRPSCKGSTGGTAIAYGYLVQLLKHKVAWLVNGYSRRNRGSARAATTRSRVPRVAVLPVRATSTPMPGTVAATAPRRRRPVRARGRRPCREGPASEARTAAPQHPGHLYSPPRPGTNRREPKQPPAPYTCRSDRTATEHCESHDRFIYAIHMKPGRRL